MSPLIQTVDVPEGSKGPWTISKFVIPEQPSVALLRMAFDGRGIRPGTYTRLSHKSRGVVMSDTTAEQRDHSSFAWAARGHVLINGLGIGMCLAAALRKDIVTKATVVEIDQDVIDLVGPSYTDPRVEIIHCSAFDYVPPKGVRYGAVWHDIWDEITSDNLPEMHKLHRKYGRKADWQGSWARDLCERNR